jgi:hypothetical protein
MSKKSGYVCKIRWTGSPEDKLIRMKWQTKKDNAKKEGLSCPLTFDEYKSLMIIANITGDQIGIGGDQYNLARYGDTGDYEIGNCRFITHKENCMERQ